MTSSLLLALAWKSSLCAAATLVALRLFARRSAAERAGLAHLGLTVAVAAPFAAPFARDWLPPLPVLPAGAIEAVETASRAGPIPSALPVTMAGSAPAAFNLGGLIVAAYALPAAALVALLVVALLRLEAVRRRARPVDDRAWLRAMARLQSQAARPARLLVSADVPSPLSFGLWRPVIVLDPATAAEAPSDGLLAHELAHLARGDWAMLLFGRLTTALLWFNPLAWALARRCHDLREEAADDAVVGVGAVEATDYAALLVGCARRLVAPLPAHAAAPRRGALTTRVGRVLEPHVRRAPAGPGWTLACAAAAVAVAAPLTLAYAAPPQRLAMQAGREPRDPLAEALIVAAGDGDTARVERLLAFGVDPNVTLQGDGTPLIAAAEAGDLAMVRLLLARGAQVDRIVPGDGNPLIAAAREGRLETVRLLLDSGANVNASVWTDENALIQAAWNGHADVVKLLLARGADANVRIGPRTALGMAQREGHGDVVRLLLDAGARP